MFERISKGLELAKASLRVLREEKSLVVFPLLSGIASVLVLASFAVPLFATGYLETLHEEGNQVQQNPVAWLLLFAFYFVNYFVIVFFNSALVSCALIRFHGGDPNVGDGLRMASSRLPQIAAWALLAATVGVILKAIESRSEKVGQIAVALVGGAWSIATYFVVPVLVVEGIGPLDAVKRSFAILRKTWGESLVARFGIGLFTMLATMAALIPAIIGIATGTTAGLVIGIAVTALLVITISLISATLNTIILAALYLYAAEGQVPKQFDVSLLRDAYSPK